MFLFGMMVVLVIAALVYADASKLGAHRGRLGGGVLDMGPASWFASVFLLAIVAVPAYIVVREKLVVVAAAEGRAAGSLAAPTTSRQWTPPGHGAAQAPVLGQAPVRSHSQGLATVAPQDDVLESLERLAGLHARGLLSEAEFAIVKTRVLSADQRC